MWNNQIRKGSLWTVKSLNEYEEQYEGMTFGNTMVLILSAYYDAQINKRIFTYLKISNVKKDDTKYIPAVINNKTKYIEIANLYTGDQRALDTYITQFSYNFLNDIITQVKDYFDLHKKKEKEITRVKPKEEKSNENGQQRIYKFGIDIYVTENEDVKISKTKKLILSNKAKEDIIYNSKTNEDIRILSDKYQIFPTKAIREIRNRLVYQHKQKEG